MEIKVDLVSDTGTRPSREMREFMAGAEVGDEQLLEDPSVNRLNEMVAELLGKNEAIYLPSGLMANQISYAVHCQPGSEIIMDETAHPIHYEGGACAVISGASIRPLSGNRGIFNVDQVAAALRSRDYHHPQTAVVSIEQTSNKGGGTIWPLEKIEEITRLAHDRGVATHMDGARLMNAVVASGVSASEYAAKFDSVWIDLSKGLGAPVGSVLAGSSEFIEQARYWKQRLGGAMRQAGIIAAGGIYALENNVERLAEDHQHASRLARALANTPGLEIKPEHVETNIVLFKPRDKTPKQFTEEMLDRGVRFSILGDRVRAVTHLDVDGEGIEYAIEQIQELMSSSS